ncbi:hypothetical protein X797_009722 [Metarhizium robertsii]|uniref:Uncharacterized protein n=1 Tax=Metarhizium robertsii TaxID=568076 RepID=A0A014PL24_9HYPO|nr:hypothetical protein X797_009722 [Metarhizium robertsii]
MGYQKEFLKEVAARSELLPVDDVDPIIFSLRREGEKLKFEKLCKQACGNDKTGNAICIMTCETTRLGNF